MIVRQRLSQYNIEEKEEEIDKIMRKRLKAMNQSGKQNKLKSSKKNNTQRKNSLLDQQQQQLPNITIDKHQINNLEKKYEQERFSVFDSKSKLDTVMSKQRPPRTLNNSIDLKTSSQLKNTHQSIQIQLDSILNETKFKQGFKDTKLQNPSKSNVYAQDYEVKISKMDNELQNDFKNIQHSIDKAEHSMRQEDERYHQIIQNYGQSKQQSPRSLILGSKDKKQNVSIIHTPNKTYHNQAAFQQITSSSHGQKQNKPFSVHNEMDLLRPQHSSIKDQFSMNDKERDGATNIMSRLSSRVDDNQSNIDYQINYNEYGDKEESQQEYDIYNETEQSDQIIGQQRNMSRFKQNRTVQDEQDVQKIITMLLELNQSSDIHESISKNMNKTISSNFDEYSKIVDQSFAQFARELKDKNKFFEICKNAYEPKISSIYEQDSKFNFFQICQKELVLVLPILHRIKNKSLNLCGYRLNPGLCKALNIGLKHLDSIINKISFDNNGIHDQEFKEILQGLNQLKDLKSIIYKQNEFNMKSLEILHTILIRPIPHHLEELKIVNCKIHSSTVQLLMEHINEKASISKLGLVNANLNEAIKSSRYLIEIDISWNGLRPQVIKSLIECFADNRQLQYVNLSWNNILEQSVLASQQPPHILTPINSQAILQQMGKQLKQKITNPTDPQTIVTNALQKFIKYNKNLLHLDLTQTGLNESVLESFGTALRRSKSLLSLHLTGNPGITHEIKEYLFSRVRCKERQPRNHMPHLDPSLRLNDASTSPRQQLVEDGLHLKQVLKQKRNHDHLENMQIIEEEKLIFQRILGNKADIPGSGQWNMLTQPHQQCWVCEKWIYTLIFWSPSLGYKLQSDIGLMEKERMIELIEIFNTNPQINEKPLIYGEFNNWIGSEMIEIEQYCFNIDRDCIKFLDVLKSKGLCRTEVDSINDLNYNELKKYKELEQVQLNNYKNKWKEVIQQNTKYRKPFLGNAKHLQSTMQHEQVYVFPLYIQAGKLKYIVKSNSNEYFVHTLIAPIREEEIPIFIKQSKFKVFQRQFKKDTSVFKDWKEDTDLSIQKCFEHDTRLWKVPRFVKDPIEQEKCIQIAKDNFVLLKDIFITLACRSGFPSIGWIDFTNYCEQCKIPDRNVNLATVDRLFIATNVELEALDDNPDKALCRFEYFEIIVRLANVKFKESGITATHSEAFKKILEENIFPNFQPHPWQEFRDRELWTIDVNDTLEANLDGLKKVYSHYFEPRKKWMTMSDTLNLMMKDTKIGLIEKDAIFCYGLCKMTVVLESEDSSTKYKRLQFVELLELIGRIADLKYKHSELGRLSLVKKIEFVLDDILELVELKRKEVNIIVDDQSESDDEY